MTTPLNATISGEGPLIERHRAVLASMPDRLRAVDAGGDVAMVAASVIGWTTTLVELVHGGARGVIVVDAGVDDGPEDIASAARAADAAGAAVVVDRPCALSPAWQRVLTDWRHDAADAALLDSTTTVAGTSLMGALLEQLALVHALFGELWQLEVVHRSRSVYQLAGRVGSVRLSLSGTDAPRATLTLDLVRAGRRRHARFAPIGLATPAWISAFDRTGARVEPPHFESGHRASWRRLHDSVSTPPRQWWPP